MRVKTSAGRVADGDRRGAPGRALGLRYAGVAAICCLGFTAQVGHAVCNLIPGTTQTFRGTLASTDRPFASPGDIVTLRLSPACDAVSPGFSPLPADQIVSVIFTPPNGPRNVVILSTNCAAEEAGRSACEQRPDVVTATCITVNGSGQPIGLQVVDSLQLRFRFPDTDAGVGTPTDDRTLAGSATIAVSRSGAPLPCDLASVPCAGRAGLLACVDTLFSLDGSCGTTPDVTFGHFTALPPPNDFQALCAEPNPPCTGLAPEIHFTIDADGNILLPMDWRGILLAQDPAMQDLPIARLLRGSTSVEAFPGSGTALRVPSNAFLRSFTPQGGPLPPVFDPQSDPTAANEVTLFGSADAPRGVLRVARRSPSLQACDQGARAGRPCSAPADCPGGTCGPATCNGGSNDAAGCDGDGDCPGGECGPGLFDFSTRMNGNIGPVVISRFAPGVCQAGANVGGPCASSADCPASTCVSYRLFAMDPVPLDGLFETNVLTAYVVHEAVNGSDDNGDSDTSDDVVKLFDRATGVMQPVGEAVVRIRQSPFTFPAVAVEDSVLSFLESEPAEGRADLNGNGRVFDSVLRVFQLGVGEVTRRFDPPLVADPAPLVNGRSLEVSNGEVFFRMPEAAAARQTTERVSVGPAGLEANHGSSPASVSADGRFVAFASDATNLVPLGTNGNKHIFVYDRRLGVTELVSIASNGTQGNGHSSWPTISSDGSVVAFESDANNLVPNDSNSVTDIFVHERSTGITTRANVHSNGAQANGASMLAPALSANGQYVAFGSLASNLVDDDDNQKLDVFVHDRVTGGTERVSVSSTGQQGNDHATYFVSMSGDGRFVAFRSNASNLVANDLNGTPDAFIHDRLTGTTEAVNELVCPPDFSIGCAILFIPSLSTDGRFVAFTTYAPLVAGDTNDAEDIFVHDRVTGTTERVSVASDATQGNENSIQPMLSPDGRYVIFTSTANNLVPNDTVADDVFVHDRLTGMTERMSVTSDAMPPNDRSLAFPTVSADGRVCEFASLATNLVPGDGNATSDVFVRVPDRTDIASDAFADGELDDTVLHVLNAGTGALTTLCPAEQVVVADGRAAFLRPEAPVGTASCPPGSLNDDTDTDDSVVQLWPGAGAVQNLGRAATALAISSTHLAALVSESGEGTDLNGDGDQNDTVVEVYSFADGTWTPTGQAADTVQMCGSVAVFLTPESAQGADLNGDGDELDRVLQMSGPDGNTHQAAEEFACGPTLVAFRTSEAAQNQSLNADADKQDYILQVYDLDSHTRYNTGQSARICDLEACDPHVPYRVGRDTVTFLTLECEQSGSGCPSGGEDLNGDGDNLDLVLQVFNVRQAAQNLPATTAVAAASKGICTNSGLSCASDDNCTPGKCFVPPGGCIRDLHIICDPSAPACTTGFCQPNGPGTGTCRVVDGPCRPHAQCGMGGVCQGTDQAVNRLVGPLAQHAASTVFTTAGHCVEDLQTPCTGCGAGEFCLGATCHREHGTCRQSTDCPAAAVCRQDLLIASDQDSDGDEILDRLDNCPHAKNVLQEDSDGDGVGDACGACTQVSAPNVTLSHVALPVGDDRFLLKGDVTMPHPFNPSLSPLADGLRLMIDGTNGTLLDVTLPAGAYGSTPNAGWTVNGSHTKWTYRNDTAATPAGIYKVLVSDRSATHPGLLSLRIKAKRGAYPVVASDLPLRVRVILHPPADLCADAPFAAAAPAPHCTINGSQTTVRCK